MIDPIDGTRNYVTGSGPWSVSIALEYDGEAVLAVVHDPLHDETFTATKGRGAYLNGGRLSGSNVVDASSALLAATFPTSLGGKAIAADMLARLLPRVGDVGCLRPSIFATSPPHVLTLASSSADGHGTCGLESSWPVKQAC